MEENNKKKKNWYTLYAIFGVLLLIAVVVAATYAFYVASKTAVFSAETAGSTKLEVRLVNGTTEKKLYPISDTVFNLNKMAYTGCVKDNWSSYNPCQIYEVKLVNTTDTDVTVNIGVTSLTATNAPNLDVVKMATNNSVVDNTSIKGNATGIVSNLTVASMTTSASYYFLVFVRDDPNGQTDTGSFNGVVTAATVSGPALPNESVVTAEF